jgi:hypothetical protein
MVLRGGYDYSSAKMVVHDLTYPLAGSPNELRPWGRLRTAQLRPQRRLVPRTATSRWQAAPRASTAALPRASSPYRWLSQRSRLKIFFAVSTTYTGKRRIFVRAKSKSACSFMENRVVTMTITGSPCATPRDACVGQPELIMLIVPCAPCARLVVCWAQNTRRSK